MARGGVHIYKARQGQLEVFLCGCIVTSLVTGLSCFPNLCFFSMCSREPRNHVRIHRGEVFVRPLDLFICSVFSRFIWSQLPPSITLQHLNIERPNRFLFRGMKHLSPPVNLSYILHSSAWLCRLFVNLVFL